MQSPNWIKPTRRTLLAAGIAAASALSWQRFGRSEAANAYGLAQEDLLRFRASLDGDIILPGEASYETARRTASYNPLTSFRPAAIVYCESARDVARCIEFARLNGLPLSARSGGCDILGQSSCDRGIVADLSLINEVTVTGGGRTARVGAGVTAGMVNADLAAAQLAVPLGCNPVVGVGGLTLGGGLGWLLGKHGTASDNLAAATLVTAEGEIVDASRHDNPDLFWALNGGGGNFGIVTAMTFRTHAVGHIVGGYIVYPIDSAADVLLAYPDLMAAAPRELMVELAIVGTALGPLLVAMTCYSGNPRGAEAALAPFRTIGSPVADDIGLRDYPSVGTPSPDMIARFPAPPVETPAGAGEIDNFNHWRGCNLTRIDGAAAGTIVDAMLGAPPGGTFGLGHFMKGAALEPSVDHTAMPRHAGSMCAYVSASWRHAGQSAAHMAWVDQANEALGAGSTTPTYVNYLASNAEADIRATYGASYDRLRTVKSRWDPENVFRNNRNIRVG